MILDSLDCRSRYCAIHPRLQRAFDYLASTDLTALDAGTHEIDGRDLFVNIMDVDLKCPADAKLEIHDAYLDIQLLVKGQTETIGISSRAELREPLGEFDAQKDIRFYDDPPRFFFTIRPGEFAIFFPEDAHAPMIGEGKARKAIVKVRL